MKWKFWEKEENSGPKVYCDDCKHFSSMWSVPLCSANVRHEPGPIKMEYKGFDNPKKKNKHNNCSDYKNFVEWIRENPVI